MRLTGAGVNADHIHQDIITGTVMQRPGLNDLLEVIRAGDVLVVTALDRLGRDTLGLLELIHRLATMGVELKVLDMPVDAQDVAGGGQLVALVTAGVAAIERENISRRTKQGLERARAEGKLAGRRWSISRARMRTIQRMRKDLGMTPDPNRPGSGCIGIAGAAGPEDRGRGGAAGDCLQGRLGFGRRRSRRAQISQRLRMPCAVAGSPAALPVQ